MATSLCWDPGDELSFAADWRSAPPKRRKDSQ
jgi:hypothetical protein